MELELAKLDKLHACITEETGGGMLQMPADMLSSGCFDAESLSDPRRVTPDAGVEVGRWPSMTPHMANVCTVHTHDGPC